jgi:hypothetical protein
MISLIRSGYTQRRFIVKGNRKDLTNSSLNLYDENNPNQFLGLPKAGAYIGRLDVSSISWIQ